MISKVHNKCESAKPSAGRNRTSLVVVAPCTIRFLTVAKPEFLVSNNDVVY